jgi:hypothetical protein
MAVATLLAAPTHNTQPGPITHLVVESTGVGQPLPIAAAFASESPRMPGRSLQVCVARTAHPGMTMNEHLSCGNCFGPGLQHCVVPILVAEPAFYVVDIHPKAAGNSFCRTTCE